MPFYVRNNVSNQQNVINSLKTTTRHTNNIFIYTHYRPLKFEQFFRQLKSLLRLMKKLVI